MRRDQTHSSTAELARLIALHAPYDGTFDLRAPGLHVTRSSKPYTDLRHATQTSSVCIIAQGAKTVLVGDSTYHFAPGHVAIYLDSEKFERKLDDVDERMRLRFEKTQAMIALMPNGAIAARPAGWIREGDARSTRRR